MKLINKLITKTAIYKHLKDLYEQALRDCESWQDQAKDLKFYYDQYKDFHNQTTKLKSTLRKIRTHVNKLDKKDENVKEIKRLIKEVLS